MFKRLTTRQWSLLLSAVVLTALAGAALELCVFGAECEQRATPVAASTADSTIGWIDNPTTESVISNEVIVSGWALDRVGVREVELKINGRSVPARYGMQRPDVTKAYPDYPQ